MRAAFGVCGNELAPADGRVVHVEYGCGAHSEVELESSSPVPVADLVYDDTTMDMEGPLTERAPAVDEAPTDETPTVETPADEAPADETPTDDTAVAETPAAEETPGVESAPADTEH
jgi:hypothetical protein